MPPMLSIDFGNSYTKVALRPDRETATTAIKDTSLNWDEENICVPTLAAHVGRSGGWCYGTDATRFRPDYPGLTVHRNWKPRLFESGPVGRPGFPMRRGR